MFLSVPSSRFGRGRLPVNFFLLAVKYLVLLGVVLLGVVLLRVVLLRVVLLRVALLRVALLRVALLNIVLLGAELYIARTIFHFHYCASGSVIAFVVVKNDKP